MHWSLCHAVSLILIMSLWRMTQPSHQQPSSLKGSAFSFTFLTLPNTSAERYTDKRPLRDTWNTSESMLSSRKTNLFILFLDITWKYSSVKISPHGKQCSWMTSAWNRMCRNYYVEMPAADLQVGAQDLFCSHNFVCFQPPCCQTCYHSNRCLLCPFLTDLYKKAFFYNCTRLKFKVSVPSPTSLSSYKANLNLRV